MGHLWVDAKLLNPTTGHEARARALVDTGATFIDIHVRYMTD